MNGQSTLISNAPTLRLTRSHSLDIPDSPPPSPIKSSPTTQIYRGLSGSGSMETLLEANYKNSYDQYSPTHFSKQWTESSYVVSSFPHKVNGGGPYHGSRSQNVSPTHGYRSSQNVSPTHSSRSQNVSPTHSFISHSSNSSRSQGSGASTKSNSPTHSTVTKTSLNVTYKALSQTNKELSQTNKALSQSNNALDDVLQNGSSSTSTQNQQNQMMRPRSTSSPHHLQRPKNLLGSSPVMNGEMSVEDSVKETVLKAISSLHGLSNFANQEAKMLVKSIGDCYWKNADHRQHIADVFASNAGAGKSTCIYTE